MEPEEVIRRFNEYSNAARENQTGSYEQIAIDTMTISILDGDIERFRIYHQAALKNKNGSHEQIAIDTLNMALMDRTQGRGGLVAFLLTPMIKD